MTTHYLSVLTADMGAQIAEAGGTFEVQGNYTESYLDFTAPSASGSKFFPKKHNAPSPPLTLRGPRHAGMAWGRGALPSENRTVASQNRSIWTDGLFLSFLTGYNHTKKYFTEVAWGLLVKQAKEASHVERNQFPLFPRAA